ncbi:MAG: DinB family protein [Planctomycetota bacterium]|nr:DinB family protein [Planctomycetota bacterium]
MGIEADTLAVHACLAHLLEILAWEDVRLYGRVPAISHWSPAQQVEHIAQAGLGMTAMIEKLEAGCAHERIQPKGSPSVTGRAILLTGRIPRGRAEAPTGTLPAPIPARAALVERVRDLSGAAAAIAARASTLRQVRGVGRHPMLGWFSAAQWWRFLRVHTEHHLAVIADIDRHPGVAEPVEVPTDPLGQTS